MRRRGSTGPSHRAAAAHRRNAVWAFYAVGIICVAALVFYFTRETRAVAGDFAVYREASGAESITTTASNQAWDTTVGAASAFSIDGTRTTVTLSEIGHYLVMYNLGVEIVSGTGRVETQGTLALNGTNSAYGRASCLALNLGGATECYMAGGAIVQTAAVTDTVRVVAQRTDASSAPAQRIPNSSGMTLIRLDDDWAYARVREVGGGQAFNNSTWQTVSIDTSDELDTGYSRTDGDITLAQAGRYLVTTNVHFVSSRNGRERLLATRLTLDGSEVPGTRVTGLATGDNSDLDMVASYVGVIETASPNQVLRLEGACVGEECGQTANAANGSAITIVRLPDTVETIQLRESVGGQQVDASNDPITWDTQVRVDSAAFTHSTTSNSARVTVAEDDDYLFFGAFYSDRTNLTSTVVLNPHWEWRENGTTKLQYGSFSNVNPGDSGTRRAERSGASSGGLFSGLTAGDYIEVVNTDESTGTDGDPYFAGGSMGFQGIRLSTLESPDITVSTLGTQTATANVPTANVYLGGSFVFSANHTFPNETITSITVTETGTVDASADLSNIRLHYEYDVSDPYNCVSESYSGTELQYGATSSSFSAANGVATFSGSVVASTTQAVCMYVVLDVDATANNGDTVDVEITSPSTDVVLGGGPVGPNDTVALSGSTVLQDDLLTQIHYHWRNDDGSESAATSATLGVEDTVLVGLSKNSPRRIRMEVSNEGAATSPSVQYRLEYAERSGTCDTTAGGWTDVGAVGGAWDMFDTGNLTDGTDTTSGVGAANGGLTDENITFLTPNAGVKDTSSQTSGLVLTSTEFVELEYSVVATANAVDGTSYCFRLTDAGTPLASYLQYPEVSIAADVLVSALGSHTATVDASTTDFYTGGSFVVKDQAGTRDVTSVTITEVGTIDAQAHISNIRLYYATDVSNPYDCSGITYDGTQDQFGATSTSFSSANGSTTFSDLVTISTTDALCLFVVLDVDADANDGDTIEIQITDPGSQVVVSSGSVNPNTPVGPTGSTTVQKAVFAQTHFHWRHDDGTEAGATSATGGTEDSPITNVKRTETQRLRLQVSNEGSTSSLPTVFTLEYAEHSGACSAASTWEEVGQPGGAWVMSNSINLTNGNNTTNVTEAVGGVTDENTTFLAANAGVRDAQATTSTLILSAVNFVEFEFSIEPTTEAAFGTQYCFRVVGAGTSIMQYIQYPQATIRQNQDFFIQRGESIIPNGNTNVVVSAGTHYIAPSATSSAFIRITNTMTTGAGRDAAGGYQPADQVMTYVANPENIQTSISFARFGTTNNTKVYWEIIEYTGPAGGDNEMIVRHVEANSTGNKSLTAASAVSGVQTDADMVVFLTGQAHNAATDQYQEAIFTTSWDAGLDEAVLTRSTYASGPGNPGYFSFAAVEFTGQNWIVQRAEHTYSAAGTAQTQTIGDVNDLSRAFVHAQHRTSDATTADFGHLAWLSGVGTVSFQINSAAATPANHTSVAWIIENTQTNGTPMLVTRSNGTQAAGGVEPLTVSIPIGTTVSDLDTASIFSTMASAGATTDHPRGIAGVGIASSTHYTMWLSDTGQPRSYRTEVIEWPTAVLTITQNYYRFYVDNDALDPTDPWPAGVTDLGENTSITGLDSPPSNGEQLRIRMSLNVTGSNISQNSMQFRLQYGVRDTACSGVVDWFEVGDTSSTTALWRGFNASPLDGTALTTDPPTPGGLNLSVSDRSGSYEEVNPTATNPYKIFIGDDVEYDWVVQANDVADGATYCFRMVEEDYAELGEYFYYPTVTISSFVIETQGWRWYDDETSETPLSALAASNTAPSNIAYQNALKLRVLVEEQAGRDGNNTKLKLQVSEHSDFSSFDDVADIDDCGVGMPWCYYDGAGEDNATITTKVLEGADACTGGVGDGCGTHNERSYVPDVVGEVGTTTTDSGGTTVVLNHTYDDPIFIVESISGDATGSGINRPAAAIITATTTSSFDVRIGEPDNEADTHGPETVAYIVMERGAYQLPDGRRVDVDSKSVSDYYGNSVAGASDDTCTFTQTFSAPPLVLTALQSNYNTGTPDFLTTSQVLVTANNFACSIEVPDGETNTPSLAEEYGWIAIEGGSFTNNGIDIVATTTTQSVTGWSNTPWFKVLFPYLAFTDAPLVLGTKQTRNGAEGGWVRYDAVSGDSMLVAIDERDDGERSHTSEMVAYFAASDGGLLYREGQSTTTIPSGATVEFEFTVVHNNARPNQTYFFRLFDVSRDLAVSAATSTGYPSVSTEGAALTFSVSGIASGVGTEGVTTDVTTTATSVPFGTLSLGVDKVAAQRITVSTNATEGYQILAYEDMDLTASTASIDDVTGTNVAPSSWSTGCAPTAMSCFGYHVGDNTLDGGSTRFLLNDTYAALTSAMAEIAYSSGPVIDEQTDIIYRIEVSASQPAGQYQNTINYIAVPVF